MNPGARPLCTSCMSHIQASLDVQVQYNFASFFRQTVNLNFTSAIQTSRIQ